MSESTTKLPLIDARRHADRLVELFRPGCDRIEIAGSVRREKSLVNDIEIVAIPRFAPDMFGVPGDSVLDAVILKATRSGILVATKGGLYYKQFVIVEAGGTKLDLFLCNPDTWGFIFTQRTGSAKFSHRLVTPRDQCTSDGLGGLLPIGMRVKHGRLWRGDTLLDTPEEADVFRMAQLTWVEPRDRS